MRTWEERLRRVTITVLLFVTVGYAQIPTSGNIFIGYSYDSANLGSGTHRNLNGWNGSLEGKLLPWVGIVADFSGLYGSGDSFVNTRCTSPIGNPCSAFRTHASLHNVLFGPQVSVPVGRFTPFAHALFGVSHVSESASGFSDSSTSFGAAYGGGIDYRLIHGIGWRFQGDDLQTRFFGGTQNSFRFSTGLVIHF
jgi:opacity protein-like surface antigen